MSPYALVALAEDPSEANWLWRTCGKTALFWLTLVFYKTVRGLLGS